MNKFLPLPVSLLLAAFLFAGCESDDFQEPPRPAPRKMSKAEKARKALRDPISDMLKIERKESKPVIGDSDVLSESEKKAFKESWSSQHGEAEALHGAVMEQHSRDKEKIDNRVFY
ncbi:MAG: hypothetical protein MJ016_06645 [Victivallaceae bacterium]|nr:hypothetical protein [Victivallaceae bacterium]